MTGSGLSMIKREIHCNMITMKIDQSDIRTFRFFFFKFSIVGTQCYSSIGMPYQTIILTMVTMMMMMMMMTTMITVELYSGMNQ